MSKTIIDRIRFLKLETTVRQRWEIGARVRTRFVDLNGRLPDKDLRAKTAGKGGSHCFAVYPDSFVPEIDKILEAFKLQTERQKNLF